MAKDFIRMTLIGRLGADAEIAATKGGSEVMQFSVASNGKKEGEVTWVRCSTFSKDLFKMAEEHWLTKGKQVVVTGEPQISTYQDNKVGHARISIRLNVKDIQILASGKPKDAQDSSRSADTFNGRDMEAAPTPSLDDIPF